MRIAIGIILAVGCCFGQIMSTTQKGALVPNSNVYASRPGSPVTGQVFIMTDTDCGGTSSATPTQCRWSGTVWQATGGSGSGGGGSPLVTPVAVASSDTSTSISYGTTLGSGSTALPSCVITSSGAETQAWSAIVKTTTTMTITWNPTAGFTGFCTAVLGGAAGPTGPTGPTGPSGGGVSGLTTGVIPKAASSTTLADSGFSDNGTTISTTEALVAGSITTGGATSACNGTAGCIEMGQGTAPSGLPTTGIQWIAPTGVTSYRRVLAGAGATGFSLYTFSSTTGTETFVGSSGTGSVCMTTSCSMTTPTLGAATGTSLLATGIVDGAAPMTVTTSTPVTLGGTYKSGYTINEHATAGTAITYTLPTATAGLQYCVGNGYNGSAANTGVITLATSASGQFLIWTDGTLSATGGNTTSGGAGGDFACVIGVDATHWMFRPSNGTWTKH